MNKNLFVAAVAVFSILVTGCRSPGLGNDPAATQAASQPNSVGTSALSVPPDLPTFGSPNAGSIRVAVFGSTGTVARPGYYHLPQGALVRDAVETAQGLGDFTQWGRSKIERRTRDGRVQIIRLSRGRVAAERIPLAEGDHVIFAREVY